jgi:RNA polymerase sigma factor (TIGR02999 family)
MSDVTRLLEAAASGDRLAAADLLPLIYDELRKLAAARMAQEKPGQTLDATALVHEAYLRLVGPADGGRWQNRGHFFAAAAVAMRRILVESARRKQSEKHGGDRERVELGDHLPDPGPPPDQLLAVDDALTRLEVQDPTAAQLVKLRFHVGLSVQNAGEALGLSRPTAYRLWAYARSWLRCEVEGAAADAP